MLLVSPATGRTASLYGTDDAYATLMSQLGTEPQAVTERGITPPGHGGDQIVVTWMVHDVQPWRIDRIALDADRLPEWVHTTQSMGAGPIALDGPGLWHRPADPEALARLLADLGLTGRTTPRPAAEEPAEHDTAATGAGSAAGSGVAAESGPAAGGGTAAGAEAAAGAGAAAEAAAGSGAAAGAGAAAQAAASDGSALDAATWVLPAVAGGIVVGVLGDRWLRRRRDGEGIGGGRWQLVDTPSPPA